MSRATDNELSAIHKSMSDWCVLILKGVPLLDKEGCAVLQPDGQPWLVPPSAAHFAGIRQFLKDNHIEIAPGVAAGPLHGLTGLPSFEDDNVVPLRKNG